MGSLSIEKAVLLDACLGVPLGKLWFDSWENQPLPPGPDTTLLRGEQLAVMRALYLGRRAEAVHAVRSIATAADRALDIHPPTVTMKSHPPPSGDMHDYVSLAKYWWPNPETEDGLPYVRLDGQVNQACYAEEYDYVRLVEFSENVVLLSLAAYLTEDSKYSSKAKELLITWFLAPDTCQNPNFQFAQHVPGQSKPRWQGLIEARMLIYALEAVRILDALGQIDHQAVDGIRDWFSKLVTWFRTSDQGRRAAQARNNIGFWYDLQCLIYADFCGEIELVNHIIRDSVVPRLEEQVADDGRLPRELSRAYPYDYVVFTIAAMAMISRVGSRSGQEVWSVEAGDGRSFQAAHDWLLRATETHRLAPQMLKVAAAKGVPIGDIELNDDLLDLVLRLRGVTRLAELRRQKLCDLAEKVQRTAEEVERIEEERRIVEEALSTEKAELERQQALIAHLSEAVRNDARDREKLRAELAVLSADVGRLSDAWQAWQAEQRRVQNENGELRRQNQDLANELEIADKARQDAELSLAERTRYLQAQVDAGRAMWQYFEGQAQEAVQRERTLKEEVQRLQRERQQLVENEEKRKRELEEVSRCHRTSESEVFKLRKRLANRKARVAQLKCERQELFEYAVELDRRYKAVLTSRSWRSTNVLRVLGRWIRSIVHRRPVYRRADLDPPRILVKLKNDQTKS